VKKVAFPREVLPLAPLGASMYFFCLQALVLGGALLIFRVKPAISYLPLLVPAILALILFTAALSILLSAVNVYLRDTKHLLEIVLMAWFWACPIVYSFEQVGGPTGTFARWGIPSWVLLLNPLTPVVITFQRAIYGKATPYVHQMLQVIQNGKDVYLQNGQPKLHMVNSAYPILPPHGELWYLWPLVGVIVFSAILYVIALKVFVRLEGNFAEEL
jgi:ABC-2 type transport system permease protein